MSQGEMNRSQFSRIRKGRKDSKKLAKSKNQITHLAQLALERDDQLQKKWGENRDRKQASRKRYGF